MFFTLWFNYIAFKLTIFLNNDFILGGILGFFLYNNIFVFILGISTGILVQENYGSIPQLIQRAFDSADKNAKLIYRHYFIRGIHNSDHIEDKTQTIPTADKPSEETSKDE